MMTFLLYSVLPTFAIAVLASYLSLPLVSTLAKRLGLTRAMDNGRGGIEHKPILGGVVLFFGVVVSSITHSSFSKPLFILLIGALIVTLWGAYEHHYRLSFMKRIVGQWAIFSALYGLGFHFVSLEWTFLNLSGSLGVWTYPMTILWMMTMSNILYPMRRIDGLLCGYVGIVAFFMAMLSFYEGQAMSATVAIALSGACFGFLRFNQNPIQILVGHSGIILMGYLLTMISLFGISSQTISTSLMTPITLMAVPIFFTFFHAIVNYKWHQSFFRLRCSVRNRRLNRHPFVNVVRWGIYGVTIGLGLLILAAHIYDVSILFILVMMASLSYGMLVLGMVLIRRPVMKRLCVMFRI